MSCWRHAATRQRPSYVDWLYDILSAGFSAVSVVTNTTRLERIEERDDQAAAAIERAVDAFALQIGMDPAEVRRRNFLQPSDFPLTTKTGSRV